jgi:hypothetical protein
MGIKKHTNMVLIGKPERKNHLEDLGVDGRIILKLFLNWIHLSRDIDKWLGVLNSVSIRCGGFIA